MKKHVAVNIIIRNRAGEVILQFRDGTPGIWQPLKWSAWGGRLDEGETLVQGACRELEEETGIQSQPSDLQEIDRFMESRDEELIFFMLNRPVELHEINFQEGAGLGAFNLVEMKSLNLTPTTGLVIERNPELFA